MVHRRTHHEGHEGWDVVRCGIWMMDCMMSARGGVVDRTNYYAFRLFLSFFALFASFVVKRKAGISPGLPFGTDSDVSYLSSSAACAAARRATGTRYGLQLT